MTVTTSYSDTMLYVVRAEAESRWADAAAARAEAVANYGVALATTTQGLSDVAAQTAAIAVDKTKSHQAGAF